MLDKIIDAENGSPPEPLRVLSTARVFRMNPAFKKRLPQSLWKSKNHVPINEHLTSDLFYFHRDVSTAIEGRDQLEHNLKRYMPQIVTASYPALTAAIANTQIEFDRAYRTLIKEPGYHGKNLAFIAGINIDISPQAGQLFPLTKYVPWAAYIQTKDKQHFILEQKEIVEALQAQRVVNPDRIELSKAIHAMEIMPEIKISMPSD